MTKLGLLEAFQYAVETVNVTKFEEALIIFSVEYGIQIPREATELIKAQDDNLSKEKLKEIMLKIQMPIFNYIKTNGNVNELK
jgi:hypothetical protein